MKIEIREPLHFELNIIDFDEKISSMQVKINIKIYSFHSELNYTNEYWIESSTWENFTNSLKNTQINNSLLNDISNNFSLLIIKKSEHSFLELFFLKNNSSKNSHISIKLNYEIDIDTLGIISKKFDDITI